MMSVDESIDVNPLSTDLHLTPQRTVGSSRRHSFSSRCTSYSHLSSRSILENSKGYCNVEVGSIAWASASYDLPSSVKCFLWLCSTSRGSAAKELRRQLLVLRDYCVQLGNKIKGKELLSQGGRHISRKEVATVDFNCCLSIIFSTSLVFTGDTENVAKGTLRSIVGKLKSAQDMGDENVFRAAIIEVVNNILLSTPLRPPAHNTVSATTMRSSGRTRLERAKQEPSLRDECLDFLTVEDGVPVLLEGMWRRWLNYFEEGYVRYVEKLLAEQQQPSAASTEVRSEDEDEGSHYGSAAAPTIAAVPIFTAWQSYWRLTTSAYAQFCHLLLAIFFVRTKDFSLNYLARVTKLVQYYTYQLECDEGGPIAVRADAAGENDDGDLDEEDEYMQSEEEEKMRSLPIPKYGKDVIMSRFTSARSSVAEMYRRRHKCFATEALPENLRPLANAMMSAATGDLPVPMVRYSDTMDLHSLSVSRQRGYE
ncbi:hypothetical protein, conserved [Leishmania shawi]|uniref:Uncharacterized protein n=1 Tax=Leishmania shawi TaxID=5680 RepID=A0ABR3ECH3_9TRYP